MTCCKFSSGCYLNCDFGSCRAWYRKLQQYKAKIFGTKESFPDQKPVKKHSASPKKSNHANVLSKACLKDGMAKHGDPTNGLSEKKNVDSTANTEKTIDIVNDEDEFCECDYDPPSYVSLVCSNANLVDKTRETVRSMVNIIGDLQQRCFSEKQDNGKIPQDSKSRHKSRDSLKKSHQPETLDSKSSVRHKSKKRSSASEGKNEVIVCCKQQSSPQIPENCGRQISMSAVMGKIKQGVSFLSPEDPEKQEDCEEISEDKQKRIDKCKLLENLKDDAAESKDAAGNVQDAENCYLMDKIIAWRNGIAEYHHKLQQVIPRVCMTVDRTNRAFTVKRGPQCDKEAEECKKDS